MIFPQTRLISIVMVYKLFKKNRNDNHSSRICCIHLGHGYENSLNEIVCSTIIIFSVIRISDFFKEHCMN